MNIKFFIFITLISNMGFAYSSEASMNICIKEGQDFGNGRGKNEIQSDCEELFRKAANLEAVKTSESGKISVFGFRNIIFNKQNDKTKINAGSQSKLDDVAALAIDEANQEIGVLNKKGDLLFFSSEKTGNVAPFRILKHEVLTGAKDVMINSKKDEVIVFNQLKQSLVFFSRLANNHGRAKHKKLTVLRVIRNLTGVESVTLDGEHQELFTFDIIKNRIQVFSLDNSAQTFLPVRFLEIPVTFKNTSKIEYSAVTGSIILTNSSGETATIPR